GYIGLLCPITQHVTSTVQKLIKGMPRTGLNRHRRGFATKEAGSAVHFPVSGPIGLARSHILIPYFIITIIELQLGVYFFYSSRVSEALNFYRTYCTKQGERSYHNIYQGIIKD